MSKELYSTEEVAERLGLHVRTVRGYVRDGRLRAVKIGKQYRIPRAELEAFLGGPVALPETRQHRHVDVSTVVEVDAVSRDTAHRVATALTATSPQAHEQPLRVETVYDEGRARMKIVIIGGLGDTRRLLDYLRAVLEP